jgi:L-threonylcarbamoyladenylate synthase
MIVSPTPENVELAARNLREGLLVAFPTETVYGLGGDARNPAAVARIYEAKGRPANHPVIVHIADLAALSAWAVDIPDAAYALAQAFWPGPLTLLLKRAPGVLDSVTGGQASVGLRMPSHPVARSLLQRFAGHDGGIAAPSANRFGRISATTAQHVEDDFGAEVSLVLDGGPCEVGIESTIVDLSRSDAVLLRPGAIGSDALARVLGRAPSQPDAAAPRVSGSLAAHYAPNTPSRLLAKDALAAALADMMRPGAHICVLAHTNTQPPEFAGTWFDMPAQSGPYAQQLYGNLRALDAVEADEIWIEAPPEGPEWHAVHDRLRRATHRD